MKQSKHQGFTLIETLLVIGIVALIAAVLVPMLAPSPNTQLRNNSSIIMSAIRETRLDAMRSQQSSALEINTESNYYRHSNQQKTNKLEGEMEIQLTTAEQELSSNKAGNIRFFADGSSTGGRITLSNSSLIQHIDIEWLTGRIRLKEELPK